MIDEEVSKIDVEKMFKAYYKQFYEDNIDPNKSIYRNGQKPEALEISRELLEEIRVEISDLIYMVLGAK